MRSSVKVLFCTTVLALAAYSVKAQMFDASLGLEEEAKPAAARPLTQPARNIPLRPAAAAENQPKAATPEASKPEATAPKQAGKDVPYSELPTIMRPTLDGVDRGRVAVSAVIADKEEARKAEEGSIFIFYRDFKINRMMSNRVTCDVTFVVLTTLDRKVSNLSFKLKWPKMLTSLSYDDVAPNTETIYQYTLLGDGCYSMDKTPNVIVNRCRVVGMSQKDCASRIRWIKKN